MKKLPHLLNVCLSIVKIIFHFLFLVPVKNVDAIIGGKAELPCDMYPADEIDDVYLVLWYKDIDGKPLYR